MRQFYVYIMSSKSRRIYVGVTNNLERRVYEHRAGFGAFTGKYRMTRLVYFELHDRAVDAIVREKRIKGWLRSKKLALIDAMNPEWKDLAEGWFDVVSDRTANCGKQILRCAQDDDGYEDDDRCEHF